MLERDFQTQIIDLCRLYAWRYYHTHDSRRSVAGFPDVVAVKGERLVFLELKQEKGRVSAEQQEWMDDLGGVDGVFARVVRPSEINKVALLLGTGRWPE